MDIQRMVLLAALGGLSLMLFQNWNIYQAEHAPTPIINQDQPSSVPAVPGGSTTSNNRSTTNTPALDVPELAAPAVVVPLDMPSAQGELISVTTDLFEIKIDTVGGSISYAGLRQQPANLDTPDIPMVLMQDNADQRYRAESGLTGAQSDQLPNHHTQFSTQQYSYDLGSADSLEVPLRYTSDDGVIYTKVYHFSQNSYRIDVRFIVENTRNVPWTGNFYGHLLRTDPPSAGRGGILSGQMPSFTGAAFYTPESLYNKLDFSELAETDGDLPMEAPSGWVAMLQHYFVGAWIPPEQGKYRLYNQATTNLVHPEYKIGFVDLTPTTIAPGQSDELSAPLYIGTKELERLDEQNAEGLRLTIDFGWLTVIAEPLFWVMRKINSVVGNWGWTIILITLLLKGMFLPLSAASYKSMAKMKKLSPRLKTLKERYSGDKQKFQQEMMKLYREEKVNPAGGCLPILVQIPVFIALYWVLLESVELRQAPWAFWIHDLSSKDPLYILPLIMGVSMFVQQRLNPAPMDPMQQKIMMALPVVFTVFFLSFPAGLVLYWVVNNVLSIAQQWIISKRYQ